MGVLEEVTQMKSKGASDEEVTNALKQKGVSPKEISDALSQAKIKNAVSEEAPEEEVYTPQTQETSTYTPQQAEQYYPQQQYYPQESETTYAPPIGTDTDTIMEVADQVFSDKIRDIQKQVELFSEFKTISQAQIQNIDERLKKIESIINSLQNAVLNKIGAYGENLSEIKKEMGMMQDSFSKMINQVADNSTTQRKSKK